MNFVAQCIVCFFFHWLHMVFKWWNHISVWKYELVMYATFLLFLVHLHAIDAFYIPEISDLSSPCSISLTCLAALFVSDFPIVWCCFCALQFVSAYLCCRAPFVSAFPDQVDNGCNWLLVHGCLHFGLKIPWQNLITCGRGSWVFCARESGWWHCPHCYVGYLGKSQQVCTPMSSTSWQVCVVGGVGWHLGDSESCRNRFPDETWSWLGSAEFRWRLHLRKCIAKVGLSNMFPANSTNWLKICLLPSLCHVGCYRAGIIKVLMQVQSWRRITIIRWDEAKEARSHASCWSRVVVA